MFHCHHNQPWPSVLRPFIKRSTICYSHYPPNQRLVYTPDHKQPVTETGTISNNDLGRAWKRRSQFDFSDLGFHVGSWAERGDLRRSCCSRTVGKDISRGLISVIFTTIPKLKCFQAVPSNLDKVTKNISHCDHGD